MYSALSPYIGSAWGDCFLPFFLMAVFGDTENKRTRAIIKSAPFLYPTLKLTAEFGGLIGKRSIVKEIS